MIFTDYYKFEKKAEKAKSRIDCTHSTHSYPLFEDMRCKKEIKPSLKRDGCLIGDLYVYIADVPINFKADAKRKADKAITKNSNISSVYIPDLQKEFGYGDIRESTDAVIFVLSDVDFVDGAIKQGSIIEMFIARGQAKNRQNLYTMVCEGYYDEELQNLREQAKNG